VSTPLDTEPCIYFQSDGSCKHGDAGCLCPSRAGHTETFETPTVENVGKTDGETENVATAQPLFGGLTAQEAGRRSAARRAERALAGETDQAAERRDETRTVRCTIETGKVLERLSKDAKGGNVQAARELRSWLSDLPVESATEVSALDKRTRQQVLTRVLSEIEAEELALHG
jgi:hypothetical protein